MIRSATFAAALVGMALSATTLPGLAAQTQPDAKMPDTKTPDLSRPALLDRLFGLLHGTHNADQAKLIEAAIWKAWSHSGSPSADLLLVQAVAAMKAQAYPTAIAILDTVIEMKPDFAEAWNKRATVYFLMREFDHSLADIDQVLKLEPRHFGALAGRGMIYQELGKKREALKAYRRALSIYPEMPGPRKAVKELAPEVEQAI